MSDAEVICATLLTAVRTADRLESHYVNRIEARVAAMSFWNERRSHYAREVRELAKLVKHPNLLESLEQLLSGGGESAGIFAPLCERFERLRRSVEGVHISLMSGEVWAGGRQVRVTPRERELLLFLALRGKAHREQICEAVWPDADLEAAAGALRVTVKRVRERLGAQIIKNAATGVYEMGDAGVDFRRYAELLAQLEQDAPFPEELVKARTVLCEPFSAQVRAYRWFADLERARTDLLRSMRLLEWSARAAAS